MQHVLAIDIGGTKLAVGVFHGAKLIERQVSKTDREGGPAWMLNQIEAIAGNWVKKYSIQSCGIGFGGPVDVLSQRVICSTQVPGWNDFDLIAELRSRLGVSAVMDRDTLVGALGEGNYGAGIGIRPIFYMTISTGIGGGLLTEHGLYHGADSFAGEIGHHTVVPDGPECFCGARGCMERLCSGLWLERDFGRPASELFQDPAFVASYVKPLARGLKTCIMMFNPVRIVIGGGISQAGDRLFHPLRQEMGRQITPWFKGHVDVVPAKLGADTILYGALALALESSLVGCR